MVRVPPLTVHQLTSLTAGGGDAWTVVAEIRPITVALKGGGLLVGAWALSPGARLALFPVA
jgi:hypothetical protein